MRITFIAPSMDLTGGARVIHIYAKLLHARGHNVCVVTRPRLLSFWKRARSLLTGAGLPKRTAVTSTHFDATTYTLHIVDPFGPIESSDVPDADVVVATWWETAEWVANYPASKGRKAHFVQHYEAFPGIPKDRVDAVLRLPLYKITISSWLERMLRDRFGNTQVDLVPNSVDASQFFALRRRRQVTPTVGMMYSDHPSKDCQTGLDAFGRLAQKLPAARMVAFGKIIPRLSLPLPRASEYVLLPAQDKIANIYSSCDVWMCSSKEEGFGLPVLEAMACRCPVVSTAIGGPMDFLTNGLEGFIVPVGDADAIARVLEKVLTMPEPAWLEMSDAAYAKATSYTWNDAADRFEVALKALQQSNITESTTLQSAASG
jgi:glycosyltransferase involved in cell wall biosynthesis